MIGQLLFVAPPAHNSALLWHTRRRRRHEAHGFPIHTSVVVAMRAGQRMLLLTMMSDTLYRTSAMEQSRMKTHADCRHVMFGQTTDLTPYDRSPCASLDDSIHDLSTSDHATSLVEQWVPALQIFSVSSFLRSAFVGSSPAKHHAVLLHVVLY